jgi:predicted dehydrogenase
MSTDALPPRPRLSVGLVGLGTIARTHLLVLADLPGVDLAFAVDPAVGNEASFRGEPVTVYADLDEALERHGEHLDLVVITAPTSLHAELTAQVLEWTTARVLVEKPLVGDLAGLDRLRRLLPDGGLRDRVFVAHHYPFAPEVTWAADLLQSHAEWGPITAVTAAFHDPYVTDAERAFTARTSSWVDSGTNQLTMLSRFVDITDRGRLHEEADGATSWCTASYLSRGTTGAALLRTSWEAAGSSKRTTLRLDDSATEIWLDHTAVTGFVARGGAIVDQLVSDGRTPRMLTHYRPLYRSLLSDEPGPDPVLGFDQACNIVELLHR